MTPDAGQLPARIDPGEAMLLLTDCQPGLSVAADSRPHQDLVGNVTALVRTAAVFGVPIVATTSATERFGGHLWPAIAGLTAETHQLALNRAAAAGTGITSWIQLLLEWQQDWTHSATYAGATGILTSLGGSYGLALLHAWDMLASPAATGQQTAKTAR
jgi:hypothetical protein